MFSWLWGCMVLAFKAGVGSFLWSVVITGTVAIFAGIIAGIAKMME